MRPRCAVAGVLALLVSAALAPAAYAAYDPVGSGTTRLTLDQGFRSFLRAHGVKLTAAAPARLSARTAVFPAAEGEVDPTIGKGTVELEGGLVLRAAGKHLPLDQLMVKAKRTPLLGKLGGGQLKIATASRIAFRREGFGAGFTATKLKLTAKAAIRLNKRLRLGDAFSAGQLLGSLLSKTEPATTTVLSSGKATIVFDSQILAKLDVLHVSVNPIFPAEHVGPTFTFPIVVGGAIAPDGSSGTLRSGGDLEFLQLGGGQVFWHELWLDLGARVDSAEANVQPSPPYPGKLGRVGILDLGPGAVSSEPAARTVTFSGAPLYLQAATASSFNQAFAQSKEVFRAGEALGTVSFTAQGQ
jgi:hypothetical protein